MRLAHVVLPPHSFAGNLHLRLGRLTLLSSLAVAYVVGMVEGLCDAELRRRVMVTLLVIVHDVEVGLRLHVV